MDAFPHTETLIKGSRLVSFISRIWRRRSQASSIVSVNWTIYYKNKFTDVMNNLCVHIKWYVSHSGCRNSLKWSHVSVDDGQPNSKPLRCLNLHRDFNPFTLGRHTYFAWQVTPKPDLCQPFKGKLKVCLHCWKLTCPHTEEAPQLIFMASAVKLTIFFIVVVTPKQ